jgi:hypothetical protein
MRAELLFPTADYKRSGGLGHSSLPLG